MDNGYGFLIFVGIIILGIAVSHEYTKSAGFTIIAVGFIAMGLVGAMLNYLDNKNG